MPGQTQQDLQALLTRMQQEIGDPTLTGFVVLCQVEPDHHLRVLYFEGVVHVLCQACDTIIMDFAIALAPEETQAQAHEPGQSPA